MTRSLIFNIKAEEDLDDIQNHYDKISPTLTERFLRELSPRLDLIRQDPTLFQIRYRGVRISPLRKFPFGVHYVIMDDVIIIMRILHFKRYFKQ